MKRWLLAPTRLVLSAGLGVALVFAAPVQATALEAYYTGLLDWQARTFFWVNRQIFSVLNGAEEWLVGGKTEPVIPKTGIVPPRTALERGVGNVAANLVNEPITAATNLIIGNFGTSWVALQRFAINSTIGLFGWYDVATDLLDIPPQVTDVGLVLCGAGIGEGGYVVLPFIGPRTVRDGVADAVLTNVILWTMVGASLGTGASWETIVIAESIEVVTDLVATRQIDPNAKVNRFDDFEAVRKAYLEQRRIRCKALRTVRSSHTRL